MERRNDFEVRLHAGHQNFHTSVVVFRSTMNCIHDHFSISFFIASTNSTFVIGMPITLLNPLASTKN